MRKLRLVAVRTRLESREGEGVVAPPVHLPRVRHLALRHTHVGLVLLVDVVAARGPRSGLLRLPAEESDMAEATPMQNKSKAAKPAPAFETPKFEIPSFDMPKMEVPAAFREIAEKSVSQAKETWEKMKSATEEATDLLEDSYATASKGTADYNLKLLEMTRTNTNAAFDFAAELFAVKSLSEFVELSTAYTRKQFETATAQTKELTALAQKVTTDTVEPIKAGVTNAFKKVA